jgi:hypothetical protein
MEVAWIHLLIKLLQAAYAEMRKLTDEWIQKHRNNNLKNKVNNTTELLSTTLLYFISSPCHGSKIGDAAWPPLTYPIVHCVLMCLHTGENNKMRVGSNYEWTSLGIGEAIQHVSNFHPRLTFKAKTSFNNESRFSELEQKISCKQRALPCHNIPPFLPNTSHPAKQVGQEC